MVALVDAGAKGLGRRDREAHLDLAALELANGFEAGVAEDSEHRRVVGQHLGDEALDPGGGRALGELLEQPRPDPAPLELVGDREGDLRRGLVPQAQVLGHRDDLVACDGDEHAAVAPVRVEEVRDQRLVYGPCAVEALVKAVLRQPGKKRLESAGLIRGRRSQPQRRPVAENHIRRGGLGRLTRRRRQAPPLVRPAREPPERPRARP